MLASITGNLGFKVSDQSVSDVKKYLADMGIDLVGFGFVKNSNNAVYNESSGKYPKDANDTYIKSYLTSEIKSYSFEAYGTIWDSLSTDLPLFKPLFDAIKNSTTPQGMIKFGKEPMTIFGVTQVSGNIKIKTNRKGKLLDKNHEEWLVEKWIRNVLNNSEQTISYNAKIKKNDKGKYELVIETRDGIFAKKVTRTYDLKAWVEQYGLPSYFLLALHIGTMAPDFALTVSETIEPKVEFEMEVCDVRTVITRDCEPDECAEEGMSHSPDYANATALGNGKFSCTCSNCCGAVFTWTENQEEQKNSNANKNNNKQNDEQDMTPSDVSIQGGRKTEAVLEYKTVIPYIKRTKTWYNVTEYTIMHSSIPLELPEYVYDGTDPKLQGTIVQETILNPIQYDNSKTVICDNSQYFRALLSSNPDLISRENYDDANEIGYEEALQNKKYIDPKGYKIYPGTSTEDTTNLEQKIIEPTSSMQMAIEIIENAPGSGSKVIARELKKVLAEFDFAIHHYNYPTTVDEAKIGTFLFIIPNYYPNVWPTADEIGTESTQILASRGDSEGFDPNSPVIMPATGVIKSTGGNSITLQFTDPSAYGMTMVINGVVPESDIEYNDRGEIDPKTKIGYTTSGNITITLRDKNNELLNVFEYMDGVYLRYPCVIAKGLAYPIYYQSSKPWKDIIFYWNSRSQTDENNKTYEEVGSGSMVIAMALSALTKTTVTPEAIKYRLYELKLEAKNNDSNSNVNSSGSYVQSDGLNPKILVPEGGGSFTNPFLDSYGVESESLGTNGYSIKNATKEGYPVIVYASYTDQKELNKQYFLILPSPDKKYDFYLIDTKKSENTGYYTASNFTNLSYDTSLNIESAFALRKQI